MSTDGLLVSVSITMTSDLPPVDPTVPTIVICPELDDDDAGTTLRFAVRSNVDFGDTADDAIEALDALLHRAAHAITEGAVIDLSPSGGAS